MLLLPPPNHDSTILMSRAEEMAAASPVIQKENHQRDTLVPRSQRARWLVCSDTLVGPSGGGGAGSSGSCLVPPQVNVPTKYHVIDSSFSLENSRQEQGNNNTYNNLDTISRLSGGTQQGAGTRGQGAAMLERDLMGRTDQGMKTKDTGDSDYPDKDGGSANDDDGVVDEEKDLSDDDGTAYDDWEAMTVQSPDSNDAELQSSLVREVKLEVRKQILVIEIASAQKELEDAKQQQVRTEQKLVTMKTELEAIKRKQQQA